jgi:hypothetical protein
MGTTSREASCIAELLERAWGQGWQTAYHARRGEGVPTQSDAILVLDVAPLLFQGFIVHGGGSVRRECGHVVWIKLPLGAEDGLFDESGSGCFRVGSTAWCDAASW